MKSPRALWYCPEFGNFYRSNKRAGSQRTDGYRCIKYLDRYYLEHRLAFLFMTGSIPYEVDHRDRVRNNNIWENLKSVTDRGNSENKISNVGFIGVNWLTANNKWIVRDTRENGRRYLGLYITHLAACYKRWSINIKE